MQRWLPEYARIRTGWLEVLLGALSCAILPTAHATNLESSQDPFESSATLAPMIAPEDLMWQSTLKGFASRSLSPHETPADNSAQEAGPRLQAPNRTPVAKGADRASASPSPFQRWISPRTGTTTEREPATKPEIREVNKHPEIELSQPARTAGSSPRVESTPHTEVATSRRNGRTERSRAGDRNTTGEILNPPAEANSQIDAFEQALDAEATPLEKSDAPQQLQEREPEIEPTPQQKKQLPPLTRNEIALRNLVRRVLRHHYLHPLNTRDRSPWEVIHMALSYELHSRILQGGPDGKPVSAIGWLCFNQPCRNLKLMYMTDEGELSPRVGPALQGHRGQLLAILAQCNVSSEYPMLVDGQELKIRDLIVKEMKTCYPRSELTFKLIGLMHYLDSETQWVNDQGMQWNMRKLVAEELVQPLRGAACGGTHRLSGLTLAYKAREARGESVDGEYLQAKRFATQHQLYAYRLQNPDGSFSTNWFQGRENKNDIDRKLKTTGHILEWLLYSATDREINSPRTARAVAFLANTMYSNRYHDWEAGPLGHALHALLVYDKLKFAPYDEPGDAPLAIRDIVAADKNLRR